MDKQFHPTHYNVCNYLSTLGLKVNRVCKRSSRPESDVCSAFSEKNIVKSFYTYANKIINL